MDDSLFIIVLMSAIIALAVGWHRETRLPRAQRRTIKAYEELNRLQEERYRILCGANAVLAQHNAALLAHIQREQSSEGKSADWWKNGGRPPMN